MSDHDHDNHLAAPTLSEDELRARLDRAEHGLMAMRRLVFALKELVPRAFEEGFRRRQPEVEEPWLVDWLQSDAKRALDPLFTASRPQPPEV